MPVQLTPKQRNATLDGFFFNRENLVACFYRGAFDLEFMKLLEESPGIVAPIASIPCSLKLGNIHFHGALNLDWDPSGITAAFFEDGQVLWAHTLDVTWAPGTNPAFFRPEPTRTEFKIRIS